jgi:chemotaxis family two-component system response regulator Rcp1
MNTTPLAAKTHLLVIEDNPADVALLRHALAGAGVECQLTVIDDGADAMTLFRQTGAALEVPQTPDLAIVDLNLPKHSGIEIIEQMRANPRFAEVPIVIFTSSASLRDRARMEKFLVKRYIVKPADLGEFMNVGWQIRELLLQRGPHNTR